MILSTTAQVQLLLSNVLAGFLTGVLFDIYRSIRGFDVNKVVMFIEDILFWILAGVIVFIFLFLSNYAYIGFHCYVYIGVGLFLYLKIISKSFLSLIKRLSAGLAKGIRLILNFMLYLLENIFYVFLKNKKK